MSTEKDPVCGMNISSDAAAATRQHQGQTYHFCSTSCVQKFDQDPQRYAPKPGPGSPQGAGQRPRGT